MPPESNAQPTCETSTVAATLPGDTETNIICFDSNPDEARCPNSTSGKAILDALLDQETSLLYGSNH